MKKTRLLITFFWVVETGFVEQCFPSVHFRLFWVIRRCHARRGITAACVVLRGCEVHMTCDVAVTNCPLRYARSVGRSSRRWDGRWRRPTDRRKSCLLSRRRTDSPWRFGPPSIVCTGRFVSRLRRCHLHCILLLVTQWAPCVALEVIIVKKTWQFKTSCKDDCGWITQLKQQISKRRYYLAAHRRLVIFDPPKNPRPLTDHQKCC